MFSAMLNSAQFLKLRALSLVQPCTGFSATMHQVWGSNEPSSAHRLERASGIVGGNFPDWGKMPMLRENVNVAMSFNY